METEKSVIDSSQKVPIPKDHELLGSLHLYPKIVPETEGLGIDVISSWPSFGYEETEE